mgnify:CR=1 FL=1
MRLDPRTKLLTLAVTSVSVFMNKSIAVECVLAGIPLVLLSVSGNLKRTLKYAAFFLTLLFLRSKTFAQTGGTNPLLTLNTSKPVLIFNTDTVLLFAVFVNIDPRNNDLRKALIFPSVGIGTAYSSPP